MPARLAVWTSSFDLPSLVQHRGGLSLQIIEHKVQVVWATWLGYTCKRGGVVIRGAEPIILCA